MILDESYFRLFHSAMKREDAEVLLKPYCDGLFLVCESVHFSGNYTLGICCEAKADRY